MQEGTQTSIVGKNGITDKVRPIPYSSNRVSMKKM